MDETIKAYIAGIIDGEGCIGIYHTNKTSKRRGTFNLLVRITMCSLKSIAVLHDNFGGFFSIVKNKKTKAGRMIFLITYCANDALNILQEIYPYLINKKEQAKLAIEFQEAIVKRQGKRLTDEEFQRRKELMKQIKLEKLNG